MAIGILEPTAASVGTLEVTGTVLLEDLLDSYRGKGLEVKSEELGHLKHDLKRPEIILQPQPSDFGVSPSFALTVPASNFIRCRPILSIGLEPKKKLSSLDFSLALVSWA